MADRVVDRERLEGEIADMWVRGMIACGEELRRTEGVVRKFEKN